LNSTVRLIQTLTPCSTIIAVKRFPLIRTTRSEILDAKWMAWAENAEVVTKTQRPSPSSFWARNARASAFTNAGIGSRNNQREAPRLRSALTAAHPRS
jgi:hypothetical protein